MASMKRLEKAVVGSVNLDRADQAEWLDAAAAAALLGVSRSTLYAYVSRGRLASQRVPGSAARRYRSAEVAALAQRHAGAHTPSAAARATLDWGLPVMASALTLIERGRFYYRGQDVLALADTASLEDVAALLWGAAPADEAWALLQARARQACGARARAGEMLHAQLARGWGLDAAGAGLLRRALVLSADHELNASSFTVRCVASTGAVLPACLAAGQAALSGPRHGGTTVRVEALWTQWAAVPRLPAAVRRWIEDTRRARAQEAGGGARPAAALPGFGHPLYPAGDPRARQLLAGLARDPWRDRVIATVRDATGLEPALDFGLVALRRALGLPEGAAFEIFAVARSVGWIAHALEQREAGALIRPRAQYTGPRPEEAARGRVVRVR